MIVKKGQPRKVGKGNFADLVRYAANPDKAELIRATNFGSTDDHNLDLAIAEAEAAQAMNTRSKTDHNYHIIVSFQEGEIPTSEILAGVEAKLADRLGLGEHHRISALHKDTDNQHLHIVFNLVHPDTGRKTTPHRDYYTFSYVARECEIEYGLGRDNGMHYITHEGEIKPDPSRTKNARSLSEPAKLMEAHRGIKSFQTWIKEDVSIKLRATLNDPDVSWEKVHETLDKHNLELVKRGKGMALVDKDNPGLASKASQAGRFFSAAQLEAKLGAYEPAGTDRGDRKDQAVTRYVEQPTAAANQQRREKQADLYKAYSAEKADHAERKRGAWEAQRESEKARYAALAANARTQRAEIKAGAGTVAERQSALKLAAMDRVLKEQQLREQIASERAALRAEFGRAENYRQFVSRRAQEGDEAALSALRGMKPDTVERDKLAGDATIRSSRPAEPQDVIEKGPLYKGHKITHQVHRNSDVSYSLDGRLALRDEGRVIRVHENKDADTIELGLRLAQKKYGEKITLTGDDEFKALAVRTAVERGVKVSFVDPSLEAMRLRLVDEQQAAATAQRGADRRQEPRPEPVEKAVFDVPFKEKGEAAELGLKWDKDRKGYSAEKGSAAAQQAAQRWPEKQDAPQTREKPPQDAPNGSEVRVSPNEEKTPQRPDTAPADAKPKREYTSVEDFVQQRNETAKKVQNVPPHRVVNAGEQIDGTLAGVRSVGTQKVALIETTGTTTKKEMVVVPLSKENEKEVQSKFKGSRIEGKYERELHVRKITRTRSIDR